MPMGGDVPVAPQPQPPQPLPQPPQQQPPQPPQPKKGDVWNNDLVSLSGLSLTSKEEQQSACPPPSAPVWDVGTD